VTGGRDQVFIGWDVGGWNCDKNPSSRDALAVLDSSGARIGQPWRGNLRQALNTASTAADFLTAILTLCQLPAPAHPRATIAIDAPLGFPVAFAQLINGGAALTQIGQSAANPYLYRATERRLVAEGVTPLSAVKDMIGSQSTKAMHAVARYTRRIAPGVWSDGAHLTLIETYPALCRSRARDTFNDLTTAATAREIDILDAEVCAQIARAFVQRPEWLEGPLEDMPASEGWIWAPKAEIIIKRGPK
jgi:predicted nuclease with RNAse H fold